MRSVTDHVRRENALISARNVLSAVADLTDDQRFATHAAFIADILHDHRQANPELAANLARQWAADALNILSELDGTNSMDNGTSTASQAHGVLGSAHPAEAVDQAADGRDNLPPSSPVRGGSFTCNPGESGGQA